MFQWLAAPEWNAIVKTLLHTLWQAALIAVLLALVLRRSPRATTRYSFALASLAVVIGAGLFSWALLNRPLPREPRNSNPARADAAPFLSQPTEVPRAGEPGAVVAALQTTTAPLPTVPSRWTAWLALAWVVGAGLMLVRATIQVAGAERLRRSSRPLEDPRMIQLVAEARKALRLARQVRIAVTDRLTSPAVAGVLVPTLIFPLSLLTTLTPDQIRFILLHELAHIRRGDYLANLFQLFAEALLFFNPAVWWISHQVRREREACCDALAIELCGAPVDYARTLVRVAENVLHAPPAAAPAFGDRQKNSSSLHDRIQRLLVPGYRPALRLTWRATLTGLFLSGALLVLSAAGTRLTLAAILSPQQRIEQIERKMTEYGQKPGRADSLADRLNGPKVNIHGTLRTSDGTPLPRWVYVHGFSIVRIGSHGEISSCGGSALVATNGSFTFQLPQGDQIFISAGVSNFAPAIIGPLNGFTNELGDADVVLDRGFGVTIRVVEDGSGLPIRGAALQTQFWKRPENLTPFALWQYKAGDDGVAFMEHCTELPLEVIASAPGYEITDQRFGKLMPGQELQIVARRGAIAAGEVRDRNTGAAIDGATVQLVLMKTQEGEKPFDWSDPQRRLATTTADGRFVINQLQRDATCSFAITAPGYETVIVDGVRAGRTNLSVRLGPELIVRGSVTGTPETLKAAFKDVYPPELSFWNVEGETRMMRSARVQIEGGIAHFQFTNHIAGLVEIQLAGQRFERTIDTPVDNWQITLAENSPPPATAASRANPTVKREVVFRLQHASGVPPSGTLKVLIPVNLDPSNLGSEPRDMGIHNSEVRVEIPVGSYTSIEPDDLVGYWFKNDFMALMVTNGPGPMVIDVPLIPAGAIFARARNADGTPAGGLFFSVEEVKRSPLVKESNPMYQGGDGFSDQLPRKYVSNPLPLGGVYRIVAWRGNAFCVSAPVKLTEEKPDQEVELQFPAGRPLEGQVVDPDGKPVRGASLTGLFKTLTNPGHSFQLRSVTTDDDGRFRFEDATPQTGSYRLQIERAPGWSHEFIDADFARLPLVIRVKPGLKMAGRIVESGTGYVIPVAEISVSDPKDKFPTQKTRTDADGHFEFTTLGDTSYRLFVEGGRVDTPAMSVKAGSGAALDVEVKPWPGGRLKPRPQSATNTGAFVTTNASGTMIFTNAGRQSIMEKLDTIRLDYSVSDRESLTRVHYKLAERVKQAGPEKEGTADAETQPNFERRQFRINESVFIQNLERAGIHFEVGSPITPIEVTRAVRSYFKNRGLDLSPPKMIFYESRTQSLVARASAKDLEVIRKSVGAMNAQIQINTSFAEVSEKIAEKIQATWPATQTTTNGVRVITLTPSQLQELRKEFPEIAPNFLGTVTTAERLHAQVQNVDLKYIIMGINPAALTPPGIGRTNLLKTAPIPFGKTVDVTSALAADGRTIELALQPQLLEFLGYDKHAGKVTAYVNGAKTKVPDSMPRFRIRNTDVTASVPDGVTVLLEGFTPVEVFKGKDGEMQSKEVAPDPKRHLLVFVTPTIVNSIGEWIHADAR